MLLSSILPTSQPEALKKNRGPLGFFPEVDLLMGELSARGQGMFMDSERYPEESGIAADMPFPEKQDAIVGISDELGTSRRGVQRQWKQHDVSEQELHLKEFILDNAHEAIYLIGPDLRFVYVNDEACRSLGYSREELLGMTPSDIDPDITHEHAQQIHAQLMAQGSVTIETRHRRRDGSVFSVEMQGALIAKIIGDRPRFLASSIQLKAIKGARLEITAKWGQIYLCWLEDQITWGRSPIL
jgi:PAS domain S-box-containing protein